MKKEANIVKGRIIEALPELKFKVKLEDERIITAYVAGKMRINFIKVIPGDYVMVELSPYDQYKGRIIKRL
ncbi:MAG: translation initiation factor IF-1 [Candidatus Parcubacteria bacterium]|nr:MAG: translation initiation factor IF-1 [Candidatus Parcubacteria bacterium]